MNREYHKWFSPALGREMELLIFGHAGPRVLVFPSRKKRFFEYEDYGMVQSMRGPLASGALQFICVDSIDEQSLYCFEISPEERIARHLEYERYILEEVLPISAAANPGTPLTAHGCSFGAYHALTIALRNPGHFTRAVGFSGRYDLTLQAGDFHSLFHGFYEAALCEIMPSHFVPRITDRKRLAKLRKLRCVLVIGEDDPFYKDNVSLDAAFAEKKIKHALHVWCGNAHRFRYWRQMARLYL